MMRRTFLGVLAAMGTALLPWPKAQAAPAPQPTPTALPPEVLEVLTLDEVRRAGSKVYFSVNVLPNGRCVWRRCYF